MKIKKLLSAVTMSAVLAFNTLPSVSSPMKAYAAADGGYSADEIAASELKPTLSVSSINISAEDAKASPVQTVTISLNGANKQYCSTGFHVYFDNRLTIVPNAKGAFATKGSAINDLSSASYSKNNCLFLATAGTSNSGKDGTMWTFQLKLPDDAAEGDVYPIEIKYEKGKYTEDVFVNDINEVSSKLMQAWVFTKGIQNGSISIGSTGKAGDANCDGTVELGDAVLIMQFLANPDKFGLKGSDTHHMTENGAKNSDVAGNNDGITTKDALAIQKYTLKIISSLPE